MRYRAPLMDGDSNGECDLHEWDKQISIHIVPAKLHDDLLWTAVRYVWFSNSLPSASVQQTPCGFSANSCLKIKRNSLRAKSASSSAVCSASLTFLRDNTFTYILKFGFIPRKHPSSVECEKCIHKISLRPRPKTNPSTDRFQYHAWSGRYSAHS